MWNDVKPDRVPLFQTLKTEFSTIQCATTELRTLTDLLAEYFCEEESRFNIQECFQCLLTFCKEVKKCQTVSIFKFHHRSAFALTCLSGIEYNMVQCLPH